MTSAELIVTVLCGIAGSTGLFTFIQYLISRKDNKQEFCDDIKSTVKDIQKCVQGLKSDIENMRQGVKVNMDNIHDKIDKTEALQARIRILRANDEMRRNIHHSYEYFRQLHQDITSYEAYCNSHPEFKNNEVVNSIQYINKVYQECLDEHSFLE